MHFLGLYSEISANVLGIEEGGGGNIHSEHNPKAFSFPIIN